MADWSSFGPEASPARLIEQDNLKAFSTMAQANYMNTIAKKQQGEMDRAEDLRKAFATTAQSPNLVGPPEDPVSQVFSSAERLRNLGYPEEAAKVVADGALAAQRNAATNQDRSKQRIDALSKADDILTGIAGYYEGVTDQASFDRANAVVSMATGIPSPLMGQQYSPQIINALKQSQMTARQRALIPYEIEKLKNQAASQSNLMDYRNARLEIYQAQQRLREAEAGRKAKIGGANEKDVGAPTKEEVVQSAQLIKDQYPDLPNADRSHYAYQIASEARRIRKTNPGISAAESNTRAMEAFSDQIKDVVVTEKVLGSEALGGVLGRTKTESRYVPRPIDKKPAGPVYTEIPEIARKGMNYKPGRKYQFPGGKVGVFRGKSADGKLQIDWVQ